MSTILIAYERESESDVLDELFTGRGHKVLRSANGIEALEAARREPPQLVVSDILLPKMDGFALCRKWKQDERLQSIPFIFFTTRYDDPKYERFAEELKADRFLARPSQPDALVKAVDELLAESTRTGSATQRLPVLNETNMRLSAQLVELQTQTRRLAEGESNFRRLFETCPCPLWVIDQETARHVMVNDAALGLSGYSRPEFLALHAGALQSSEDAPALPAGVSWQRRKDGQLLAVLMDRRPLEFGGRRAEIVAVCDVTERIAAEQALQMQASLQRAVLDSAADGYWLVDAQGRLLDVNPAYCRLSGYTREELLRLTGTDVELNVSGENTIRLHLARANGPNRYETKHRRRDGSVMDVEVTVGDVEGHAERRVMFIRDVSQQRDDLIRQRREQQRLHAMLELQQSADTLDDAGLVRRVLEQAAMITGSPLTLAVTVSPEKKTLAMTGRFLSAKGQAETLDGEAKAAREGPWSDVARTKQVLLDNVVTSAAHLEGIPAITRCIVVPLVEGEEVLMLLAAANRDSDYTEDDKRELTLLADGFWRLVRSKRSQARTMSGLQRADVAMQAMIETLSRVAENHDPHTAGSAERVAMLAVALGRELGVDGQKQHVLRIAGLLHDVGNVMIPAGVLAKPSRLSEHEMALVRAHPEEGRRLLAPIDFGAPVADIVAQHHERYDGSGYPKGLKGDHILLEARILGVADVVEAMCSRRASRPALGIEAALDEIGAHAGTLYDPHVAAACIRLFRQHGFSLPG